MSQTEKYQVSDLIVMEPGMEYSREAKTISLTDGSSITVGLMLEVDSTEPAKKALAEDANADSVCLENYTNDTGATLVKKFACLVRGGPMILRYDILSGEATTKATAVAALLVALTDTITRDEVGS